MIIDSYLLISLQIQGIQGGFSEKQRVLESDSHAFGCMVGSGFDLMSLSGLAHPSKFIVV